MDHLVNILVRLFVFLSRFAPVLSRMGLIEYRSYKYPEKDKKLHILLAGYNGARNTGSDVRVAEIARQLQERLGKKHVKISVMTMDEDAMRSYFDDDVRLIHCNSIFFADVFRACCASQAVILCEGSTLKSKFANALTLYSCEAAGIMKNQHKPCIAYGSEAGEMDAFLERTAKRLCSDTYFIARTQNSLDRIHSLGLKGRLGTDAAWRFDSSGRAGKALEELKRSGWDGNVPLLGVAPINPFWWPVKPSLARWIRAAVTGDHTLQFSLWYFFSWSGEREQQLESYLNGIAASVNEYASKHPCHVVILGMEQLDEDACGRLKDKLTAPSSVFLSSDYDGFDMAAVLRQLSVLITSRYHAEVLSMEAGVPCIAVSMDERLDNIMNEMDMDRRLLLHADDIALASEIMSALEFVQSNREDIQNKISINLVHYQSKLDEMGDFLVRRLRSFHHAK